MMAHTASSPVAATIDVVATRFGTPERLVVPADDLYAFPEGLPGLPGLYRYVLLADPAYAPMGWLQALDEPACCLPIVPAALVVAAGYEGEMARLIAGEDERLALLVTRYDHEADHFVTNLLAPIILDPLRRTGQQVVLDAARYPIRQPIAWDAERQRFCPC